MTNLEWLIKEKPELVTDCLSRTYAAIKVEKSTGDIGMCDDECYNCLFCDQNGASEDCVYRIAEWLKEEHKVRKQIKDLTDEEANKICDNHCACLECGIRLGNGYCYRNIVKGIKDEYGITIEELANFGKKIVEV